MTYGPIYISSTQLRALEQTEDWCMFLVMCTLCNKNAMIEMNFKEV